jgi:hypothetical protein
LICALLVTGLLSYVFLVREKYADRWAQSAALAGDRQPA